MPQYVPTGAVSVDVADNFTLGSGFTTRFLSRNYQFKDSMSWIRGQAQFQVRLRDAEASVPADLYRLAQASRSPAPGPAIRRQTFCSARMTIST